MAYADLGMSLALFREKVKSRELFYLQASNLTALML